MKFSFIPSFTAVVATFAISAVSSLSVVNASESAIDVGVEAAIAHAKALASNDGIGVRTAGSEEERQAAEYIHEQFVAAGIDAEIQEFEAVFRGQKEAKKSQNVVATIKGESDDVFVIGAHYDSVSEATGTMGVIDNAASVGVMIELAKYIKAKLKPKHTIMFLAFGAEEVGLHGAKQYVKGLSEAQRVAIKGMLNLDSITGGDKLYIHSALTSGYACDGDTANFSADASHRDALLSIAASLDLPFNKHPGTKRFPPGETASWSDHSPFACAGAPIAYIEATNFSINGEDGYDGYSQTLNEAFWNCLDSDNKTACNREEEKHWGKIWHTHFDRFEMLEEHLPERMPKQLQATYRLVTEYAKSL